MENEKELKEVTYEDIKEYINEQKNDFYLTVIIPGEQHGGEKI